MLPSLTYHILHIKPHKLADTSPYASRNGFHRQNQIDTSELPRLNQHLWTTKGRNIAETTGYQAARPAAARPAAAVITWLGMPFRAPPPSCSPRAVPRAQSTIIHALLRCVHKTRLRFRLVLAFFAPLVAVHLLPRPPSPLTSGSATPVAGVAQADELCCCSMASSYHVARNAYGPRLGHRLNATGWTLHVDQSIYGISAPHRQLKV